MPLALNRLMERVAETIENATALDPVTDRVAPVVSKLVPPGVVKDVVSGTVIGHPLHPVLVTVPIGSWVAASALDLTGGDAAAAQRLVGFGILAALPTAYAGASDWADTMGAERRVGFVHASSNYVALGIYGASWLARRRGSRGLGAALSLLGSGVIGFSGWLGGHLSYAQGVGVDTTAFQQGPEEWTAVTDSTALEENAPTVVDAAGVPVLLVRRGATVTALADRCTHRGGPLHEGELVDGCITCPWHASRFSLDDGAVAQGPATRPQPVYEVREVGGRVEVRRSAERHSLRTNPVGI